MIVSVKNVSKCYGDVKALSDVSMNLSRGQILGLLGPNGAGKSTLIRILTGYHFPSQGTVDVLGVDMLRNAPKALRFIGYLPERLLFYSDLTVQEYLQFVAKAHGFKGANGRLVVDKVVEQFSLIDMMYNKIHTLSKGYQQRLGLAQATLHSPSLLILDEPTSGLDPNQIIEFRTYIRKIAKDKSVILSSHRLAEVESICDRLLVLNKGQVLAQGSTKEISQAVNVINDYEIHLMNTSQNQVETVINQLENLHSYECVMHDDLLVLKLQFSQNIAGDKIIEWAKKNSLAFSAVIPKHSNLESLFVKLVNKGDSDV